MVLFDSSSTIDLFPLCQRHTVCRNVAGRSVRWKRAVAGLGLGLEMGQEGLCAGKGLSQGYG